jgi:hypothetical protein
MFLENPIQRLSEDLIDPLFSLIKGNSDITGFEHACVQIINNTFNGCFHLGYEYWAALSLICLMTPDNCYIVPVQDQKIDHEIASAHARPGVLEDIPDIAVSEYISMDHARITPFIIPAAILHSQKLQTFAAIAVDLHEVFRSAKGPSKKMEWLNKEAMRNQFDTHDIWPDIAIYLHNESAELRVIADYTNIARPDVVVNVMEDPDWYNSCKLSVVKTQNKALKPRLASYVVCRREIPEAAINEIREDFKVEQDPESAPIYLLDVGYSRPKLQFIINDIIRSRTRPNDVSLTLG